MDTLTFARLVLASKDFDDLKRRVARAVREAMQQTIRESEAAASDAARAEESMNNDAMWGEG